MSKRRYTKYKKYDNNGYKEEGGKKHIKLYTYIDRLTDDILSIIFTFIPYGGSNWLNTLLVNKRFFRLGKKIFDPSVQYNFAIRWASQNGKIESVRQLLKDSRIDPTVQDNYAIRWASLFGHVEVVKELLKNERVDPSADNNGAI
jgi:hypothetical protein